MVSQVAPSASAGLRGWFTNQNRQVPDVLESPRLTYGITFAVGGFRQALLSLGVILDRTSMRGSSGAVKVEILGFLPTLFSSKCKVFCNPTGVVGVKSFDQQLQEYPEHIKRNQERIVKIFESMVNDFPNKVLVKVINPTSIRGLWLAIKHRVGDGLWLVLEGRRVLDAYSEYSTIKQEMTSEMALKTGEGLVGG